MEYTFNGFITTSDGKVSVTDNSGKVQVYNSELEACYATIADLSRRLLELQK